MQCLACVPMCCKQKRDFETCLTERASYSGLACTLSSSSECCWFQQPVTLSLRVLSVGVSRRSNWLLTQDPDDDDLDIIKDGLEFARDAIRDLEREHSDTDWQYFTTGHSLGALMATALAVEQDGKVERCVFTSPIMF